MPDPTPQEAPPGSPGAPGAPAAPVPARPGLRRALAALAVIAATLAGSVLALGTYGADEELSVGSVHLSVAPGGPGALDVYVPVVDWGVRFRAVRVPAQLRVDVRAVDRSEVLRLAGGAALDVEQVRTEARDVIAGYLRRLLLVVLFSGAVLGGLVALAVRGGPARPRWTIPLAIGTAVAVTVALLVLLPPRGALDEPEYFANGRDIPRALAAVEVAQRSIGTLDAELDQQIVGLAQLVLDPADRPRLERSPQLVLASDLHNNVLAVPILDRLAGDAPVFFAGDLTDRGSPIETGLVRKVVEAGSAFVFVAGNHDSDTLERRLARDGATVLSADRIVEVAGLRVAGWPDPNLRLSDEAFADRFARGIPVAEQEAFAAWLDGLRGRADVAMVHNPVVAELALARLREDPPDEPLVVLTGHTHTADIERIGAVTVLNGGSIGAGGSGRLGKGDRLGVARLLYETAGGFRPLAADIVTVDPSSGDSTARRVRLDD